MFSLLVILFVIKLHARNNTFQVYISLIPERIFCLKCESVDKKYEQCRLIWKLCIVCAALLKKTIAKTLTNMVLLFVITLIWNWNYGSKVLLRDYHIYLISKWMVFEGITMRYNQVDLLYQHALKYYHHAENYQQSILQDITPFGLRLKKNCNQPYFSWL